MALANVFATSGKLSPKHGHQFGSQGSVESALNAARAALQPASSSVTINGASSNDLLAVSYKSGGSGGDEQSSKPAAAAPTRRRTFEALTSLASKIIPSALVPTSRQHSAGLKRGGGAAVTAVGNQTEGETEKAAGTSSLFNRRKKDSRSMPALLPSLNVDPSKQLSPNGPSSFSPTGLVRPQPLTPIGSGSEPAPVCATAAMESVLHDPKAADEVEVK